MIANNDKRKLKHVLEDYRDKAKWVLNDENLFADCIKAIKKQIRKDDEKEKVLEARKCAFGERFIHVPPWNQQIPK